MEYFGATLFLLGAIIAELAKRRISKARGIRAPEERAKAFIVMLLGVAIAVVGAIIWFSWFFSR